MRKLLWAACVAIIIFGFVWPPQLAHEGDVNPTDVFLAIGLGGMAVLLITGLMKRRKHAQ
jgi:hypothetical protein